MEDGLGNERQIFALRRDTGPYNTLNRTNKTLEELSENGQREEEKHSNAKEPSKSGKKRTTESLRTDSLVKEEEDWSKIPKRSAHNRKHSD